MSPPTVSPVTESPETERILASVQTSRSPSGARFLPFNPLPSSRETTSPSVSWSENSTESIIDKLDRVQSELSSGFLATNFGSSGNNIQLDLPDSEQQHSHKISTTLKTPVINKFVPRRYNSKRLSSTAKPEEKKTTEKPVEIGGFAKKLKVVDVSSFLPPGESHHVPNYSILL